MKTAYRTKYGPPDVLSIKEIEKPVPKENEVLIKVYAATVNRTDCGILWGKPFIIKFFTGLAKPKLVCTGTDFAGKIEAVGKGVTSFKVGDDVWGFDDSGLSSHAQYMILAQDKPITTKPDHITYEQAAASIEGAHYAYNFINKVNPKSGQKALVYGATGAIGSAAVQLLKFYNVYVTAVCGTANLELVKSLGADKVVDYTKEDFTSDPEKYDFVFDAVGKSTFGNCKKLLQPGGVYISSELGPALQNTYLPLLTKIFGKKKVIFPLPINIKRSISLVKDLIQQGKFKAVIDRTYTLEEIGEAFKYVASGQKIGNVIIKPND